MDHGNYMNSEVFSGCRSDSVAFGESWNWQTEVELMDMSVKSDLMGDRIMLVLPELIIC